MNFVVLIYVFLVCVNVSSCNAKDKSKESSKINNKPITSAVLRSQGGCLLKARPAVKEFLKKDIDFFENVTYERKRNPKTALDERSEVFFLDEDDEILEHVYLERLRRHEINQLFLDRGFIRKEGGQTIEDMKEEDNQRKAKRKAEKEKWQLEHQRKKNQQSAGKDGVVIPRKKVEL